VSEIIVSAIIDTSESPCPKSLIARGLVGQPRNGAQSDTALAVHFIH
jgi:hypothetical protein